MKGSGEPRLGVVYGLEDAAGLGVAVVAQGAAVGMVVVVVVVVKGAGVGAEERSWRHDSDPGASHSRRPPSGMCCTTTRLPSTSACDVTISQSWKDVRPRRRSAPRTS